MNPFEPKPFFDFPVVTHVFSKYDLNDVNLNLTKSTPDYDEAIKICKDLLEKDLDPLIYLIKLANIHLMRK